MAKKRIEVAVGVIKKNDKILVGQRLVKDRYFQKWEFPGGKLDNGESAIDALKRELHEELAVDVISARPLITLEHDYPDRKVRLFVYEVNQFSGVPQGAEGQALQWVSPAECYELDFLEANAPITHAVQLPSVIFITDIRKYGIEQTIKVLRSKNDNLGMDFMVQLREPEASSEQLSDYLRIFREVLDGQLVLLNGETDKAKSLGFDGVQLNRHRANMKSQKEKFPNFWVGVSCHNDIELKHAGNIADFALLSPVTSTLSHPDANGLGWQKFNELLKSTCFPCYALGGMTLTDLPEAWKNGAQGVAAISSIWSC